LSFAENKSSEIYISLAAILIFLFFPIYASSQTANSKKKAIETTKSYVTEIVQKSYPKIKLQKVHYKTFESETNFFKARFSFGRFLTFRPMRHLIYVNPKVFTLGAPEDGIRSILAHELAHVLYYTEKNRLELLGLASLASKGFIRKFERKADLETIARGYGEGLIAYREWLYKNIPKEDLSGKRRNYFSPEEIALMLEILKTKPKAIEVWRKNVPINIDEIKNSV